MRRFVSRAAWILVSLAAACTPFDGPPEKTPPRPDTLILTPASFSDLPGWSTGQQAGALSALRRSCVSKKIKRPAQWSGVALPQDAGNMCAAVEAFSVVENSPEGDKRARRFFERWFSVLHASNNEKSQGLFTGYFEASLKGSRTPHPDYPTPLYGVPDNHVSVDLSDFVPSLGRYRVVGRVENGALKPYFDRAAIDAGALAGQELLWVSDPIDAFILHVQGSGRVTLPDGDVARVGFAAHNGHKYQSIGRSLIKRGDLKRGQASWPDIRAWIETNPDKASALLAVNKRYIFFKERAKPEAGDGDGPIGAQGVALTPRRSLAVDRRFIPLGVPIWLDTTWPSSDKPIQRLMVAQDTGGAIRGPVRGDFFWGHGDAALAQAGKMKSRGQYFILIPRAAPFGGTS
jgi:membrane-bound lytic murein transglycosylase A